MKKTSLEAFIRTVADRIIRQSDWQERQLTNSSVILRKRLRSMNDDDRTGMFSALTGNWVNINTSGIYDWNIVKPTIRANTSAMVSARVKIDIESRFIKDSTSAMAAEVAKAVLDQIDREQWTQQIEEQIAQESQLGAGVFLRVHWDKNKKAYNKVATWSEIEVMTPGEAVCGQCGATVTVSEMIEADDAGFAAVECSECGGQAEVMQFPKVEESEELTGYEDASFGRSCTTVHPFWEFRVDVQGTEGGNLRKARWFEHHYLKALDEIALEYPNIDADGSAAQQKGQRTPSPDFPEMGESQGAGMWSYPLKWQWALKTGRPMPMGGVYETVDDLREIRDIYLTPSMYLNVQFDTDFELRQKDDKQVKFFVKAGDTLEKAKFYDKPFKEAPVLCFRIIDNNIYDIFPADFADEYSYISFLHNPSSFWALFATELISLQDIVNYMLTLQVYHIRRNAITNLVYNRSAFDPDDFSEDLIPTKEEFPFDQNIRNMWDIIPAPTMNGEPMQMFQMVVQGKGDVSQVQPAMVGESQPGQPYHAQLLQKQQSLGLLAPALKSKAQAKVQWAIRQLQLMQEYWTDEDTEVLLKLNSEWTKDFIDAFLECDLTRDLIIDAAEGSEIPRNLIEREMQLRQFMTDLMTLASVNPAILSQQTINDLLLRLTEVGNIGIDIDNTQSDTRLAESRFQKLRDYLAITDADVTPDTAMELAAQLMGQPLIKVMLGPQPREDNALSMEFYSDRIRLEAAKDDPDYLLIACLQIFNNWCDEAMVMDAQRQQMMQMAAMAPMQLAAQMEQEAQHAQGQLDKMTAEEQNSRPTNSAIDAAAASSEQTATANAGVGV